MEVVALIQGRSIAKLSKSINILHPENGPGTRSWGLSNPPLFPFFFPEGPLQEVISLRNPITLLSGSLQLLSVAEDYLLLAFVFPLLLLSPIMCLPTGRNCKASTWWVARAPHLTPEVGMRTGLCRSGTKVCVGGQELSLKMCALGSAPCTEVWKNMVVPTSCLPEPFLIQGPCHWLGPLLLTPGCCPVFLGRFIVWLLPSHAFPLSLPTNVRAVCRPHCPISECLLTRDHCEDHTCRWLNWAYWCCVRILRLHALEDLSGETVTRMYSEDLGERSQGSEALLWITV